MGEKSENNPEKKTLPFNQNYSFEKPKIIVFMAEDTIYVTNFGREEKHENVFLVRKKYFNAHLLNKTETEKQALCDSGNGGHIYEDLDPLCPFFDLYPPLSFPVNQKCIHLHLTGYL